jgi:hypothetical protein
MTHVPTVLDKVQQYLASAKAAEEHAGQAADPQLKASSEGIARVYREMAKGRANLKRTRIRPYSADLSPKRVASFRFDGATRSAFRATVVTLNICWLNVLAPMAL